MRIFFTRVPCLISFGAPFTFKSLMTVTVSPSCNLFPLASIATGPSSTSEPGSHSYAHSGHTNNTPSSYVYSEPHLGQFGNDIFIPSFF